jgi:predicted PurR-regulated permease PerM
VKPWITYTLIRVGTFAAAFALLYGVFSITPWLSALIAAVLGLSISYLFFRRQRDAALASLAAKPTSAVSDEEAEG